MAEDVDDMERRRSRRSGDDEARVGGFGYAGAGIERIDMVGLVVMV
jgi:hypothetical protein